MTPQERRNRGTELCRRLTERVADVSSPGLGLWDPVWNLVAGDDTDFLMALVAWESEPTEAARERVRVTYLGVVDAWGRAVAQYDDMVADVCPNVHWRRLWVLSDDATLLPRIPIPGCQCEACADLPANPPEQQRTGTSDHLDERRMFASVGIRL